MNTKPSVQLSNRLARLAPILDLSVTYLSTEVAELKDGDYFGELALKSAEDKR